MDMAARLKRVGFGLTRSVSLGAPCKGAPVTTVVLGRQPYALESVFSAADGEEVLEGQHRLHLAIGRDRQMVGEHVSDISKTAG